MPLAPFTSVFCLFDCLSKFSAESSAGSLASGCSFDVTCFKITVVLGAEVISFGAQNESFGMPVASALVPWRAIERSSGTWERTLGSRLGFLLISG